MGRREDALRLLTEADHITGGASSILINLAVLLGQLRRDSEAIVVAERVLANDPNNPDALRALGIALMATGRYAEAVAHFRQLAALEPKDAGAFLNLGEALLAADRYQEALCAYEDSLACDAGSIATRVGLGQALAMLRQFSQADAQFEEASRFDPATTSALYRRMARTAEQRIPPGWQARAVEVFLSRRWAQQQVCDWRFRTEYLDELCRYAERTAAQNGVIHDVALAFQSHTAPMPENTRRDLLGAVARGIITAAGRPVRRRLARVAGPVRIGFLSPNFREHPSAQLNWRLLALLDRTRFRVFGYSLLHSAGPLRERVVEACDVFREVSSMSGWEIAKRIALDDIDILVDLAGHMDHARPEILALLPAPLRVSYLGSPGAMGSELVDYRITDHYTTPPEDAACWSEKLVFLPQTVALYNNREAIAATNPTRTACSLPEDGFVFCCFNASYKIEPEVFAVWMRLLARVPDSVLWLLDTGQATRDNLRREAAAHGVAPERIVFAPRLPRAEHLARHACADLFLDTFYCGAMATAGDALWSGLPVLTCSGTTMAARMSGTIVRAAGLPEMVLSDRAEYEAMAIKLATRPDALAALRQKLALERTMCPLFDTERRARELGQAFQMMWERHAAGLPPESFDVPDEVTHP